MNPLLIGSRILVTKETVFLVGGQNAQGQPSNKVYSLSRSNPTALKEVITLKQARISPMLVSIGGNKVAVLGGSEQPLMEAFTYNDLSWQAINGTEKLSASFFAQLRCYTTDERLNSCCTA